MTTRPNQNPITSKRNLLVGQSSRQQSNVKNWVRGTFLLPISGPALFPKNFLTSPTSAEPTTTQTADFKAFTLDDGTEIKERIAKKELSQSKKRKRDIK